VTEPQHYDAIILGAGGAGLMCAATAGQRSRRVLLIDHNAEPGRKILISGGGRCNFTNLSTPADRYLSANRHFAKSALARYTPQDFIALVERHNIAWHEKTLGQLFCDGPASQIVAMLRNECARGRVEECYASAVHEVSHADGQFTVRHGERISIAPKLAIATGGLSIPKLGATGLAYDLAKQFGLEVIPPRPALVPLTLPPGDALFTSLSGVAAPVIARTSQAQFREAALFTHKGLSGPAILQISSYWQSGTPITINFLPDHRPGWLITAKKQTPRVHLAKTLATHLPARLAEALAARLALSGELANLPDRTLTQAGLRLANWHFTPSGTEGFKKAEVTAGGIATSGLSSKTMQAKSVPGLYAIGEAVDVTGWLGGYNFQWAWSSAVAAGRDL
jgi:predicted Rossmann fold flavoprotein